MRLVWSVLFASSLFAAPPELKSLLPAAGTPGSSNVVVLSGSFDPWPPKVWCDQPGVTFTAETNKNRFVVTVAADAKPGARLVRVYNEQGVSEPRFFVVDPTRQFEEKEPNSRLMEAMDAGSFPVVVNGRLNKNEDVDCFKISLRKGDWLDARLEAYTLMSKLDGVLKLVTTNGVTVAWNHDYGTFDPHLWWRAPEDQELVLQVFGFVYPADSSIRLYGGDEANYRLHLTNTPRPEPCSCESGPNDGLLPLEMVGSLASVGKEDRYEFAAKKDQFIEAGVQAARVGSHLDAWLKIVDGAGKQMAFNDDANGSRDPFIEWKATESTNFFLVIGSTLHRADSEYHYRLSAREVGPEFRAVLTGSSLMVTNGGTNSVKFNLKRMRGHTNDLTAEIRGLPDGLASSSLSLSNKTGEVSIPLWASNESHQWQGPIRLALLDANDKTEKLAVIELTSRGEDNGVPNGYSKLAIESYDQFWLTVRTQVVKEIATNSAAH